MLPRSSVTSGLRQRAERGLVLARSLTDGGTHHQLEDLVLDEA
jgi:hypothetical protein